MTCKNCGFDNKEDALLCEMCERPLKEETGKTVWDKLFIINILTCSTIIGICILLLIILYFFG